MVDLACTFEKLFCSNIVHICFGEDVSDLTIDIDVPEHRMSWNWSRKTMILSEAIHAFSQQVIDQMGFKWLNFFYQAARKVTGVKDFTNYQKIQAANGMRIREAIRKYVE